jgi:hypothetical protein
VGCLSRPYDGAPDAAYRQSASSGSKLSKKKRPTGTWNRLKQEADDLYQQIILLGAADALPRMASNITSTLINSPESTAEGVGDAATKVVLSPLAAIPFGWSKPVLSLSGKSPAQLSQSNARYANGKGSRYAARAPCPLGVNLGHLR